MLKKISLYIVLTPLLFSFIYQYSLGFIGLPEVFHSNRIASIGLIIVALFLAVVSPRKGKSLKKCGITPPYSRFVIAILGLTLFSFFQYEFIGKDEGIHLFECMLNILIFTLPTTWAVFYIFKDIDDFMVVLLLVGIIQSIVIILCILNPQIATAIDITFNKNFIDFTNEHRVFYAGGIGCITSTGVIRYSTCLIPCVYFYLKRRNGLFIILFLVLAIIASMIARTGVVYGFVALLFMMKGNTDIKLHSSSIKIFAIVGLAVFLFFAFTPQSFREQFSDKFSRLLSLKEQGARHGFFEGYFRGEDTVIPPLELETILGTGMVTGKSGNRYEVHVDGGPLRMYGALGLPLVILVYFVFLRHMMSVCRHTNKSLLNRRILWLLFLFILIGDFKEFTLFQVWPFCLFYALSHLTVYEKQISIQKI